MLNSILVLRDVPKAKAQIDLLEYPLKGGFRGFDTMPTGFHAVAIQAGEGFTPPVWFFTQPRQAVVLRYSDETRALEPDSPENTSQYTQLALSGAMSHALYPYVPTLWDTWSALTGYIVASIPALHSETLADGQSRFSRAFVETHAGQIPSFLAEFQYSFIRWWVHLSLGQEDDEARNRWVHLLNALYNAGERTLRDYQALFVAVVPVLLKQLERLPETAFAPHSAFTGHAGYLAEDLMDTEEPALVSLGTELRNFLVSWRS